MVIKNYTFEAEPVLMDFHDYRHCVFRKCRLIYCGYSAVTIDACRFDDCRWEFGGPALATLQFLAHLNQSESEMSKFIVNQALSMIQQAPTAAAPAPQPPPAVVPKTGDAKT
mgnify:CR=1 FL=1